jgi:hypothetical protein
MQARHIAPERTLWLTAERYERQRGVRPAIESKPVGPSRGVSRLG